MKRYYKKGDVDDFTNGRNDNYCMNRQLSGFEYYCTRPEGHTGNHAAGYTGNKKGVLDVWENEADPDPVVYDFMKDRADDLEVIAEYLEDHIKDENGDMKSDDPRMALAWGFAIGTLLQRADNLRNGKE